MASPASASLLSVCPVPFLLVAACPKTGFLATLRSVCRSWGQGVHRALACSDVRHSLGYHLWDHSVPWRTIRLDRWVSCDYHGQYACTAWSPSGDRLACLQLAGWLRLRPHRFAVLSAADGVLATWETPPWSCTCAHLRFLGDDQLVCVLMGESEWWVAYYQASGELRSSHSVDLRGVMPRTGGFGFPAISPDGRFAAQPLGMPADTEEEYLNLIYSTKLVLVNLASGTVEWAQDLYGDDVQVVGFVPEGVIIHHDDCIGLADGRRFDQWLPCPGYLVDPHFALSDDGTLLTDGSGVFRIERNGARPGLAHCFDLQIKAAGMEEKFRLAWSADATRLACVRAADPRLPCLDIFDAGTGALLSRSSLAKKLSFDYALAVSFSRDGCFLAVTMHGEASGNSSARNVDDDLPLSASILAPHLLSFAL